MSRIIRSAIFAIASVALVAPGVRPQSSPRLGPREKVKVAADLAQRVAKFKRVTVPFDSQGLSVRERKMVEKLVDASGLLDCIYWRQSDPDGLKLYLSLANSANPQDKLLREYLKINGSRFDQVDNNKPFAGANPMPPGAGFFPDDLTRQAFDAYVAAHTAQKRALYDSQSMVRRKGNFLEAVPYHTAFREFLVPMATNLREAARFSDDPAFANFLRLRADALFTDDYYASDIACLGLANPKFDVVFAPYETYLDGLLGVKTSYGAAVMIRNEKESRKLAVFQKFIPGLQESLPLAPEDLPSKRGKQSPMEVMDAIYRAGDLLHGYQAVADNLPNDPRIHEAKGSKKIFWKNFMDSRVNDIILPLARIVMRPDQADLVSGEGYLDDTIMHEISHGLGPAYARTSKGKTDIREAIGAQYSALEEAKADVVGELCIDWLVEHGAVPREKHNMIYASYVAGIFRTIRFGAGEAHGSSEIMEFNYLLDRGAIRKSASTSLYEIDFARMPPAIASLAKELLEQEATGDRARVDKWFAKCGAVPSDLSAVLGGASNVPVDVDPEFSFSPPVR